MVQNDKKFCRSRLICQEPYIIRLSFVVHMCKMIISPGVIFHFFKILIFWVVRAVKSQKMVQNVKKLCLSRLICQEPYIIWLSFMLHLCKMMISPGIFFHFFSFKILTFWVARGVKGQKTVQNDKKICPLHSISQEPYIIWLSFMVDICKMIISSGFFFIFSKFQFSGSLGG